MLTIWKDDAPQIIVYISLTLPVDQLEGSEEFFITVKQIH